MANASYDTLTIVINADSAKANTNIGNLSKNLQKLDEVAKKVDTERLEKVRELLQNIANIDFSNVSQGLASVVNAFNQFEKATTKTNLVNILKNADFSSLSKEAQDALSGLILQLIQLESANISTEQDYERATSASKSFTKSLYEATKGLDGLAKTTNKTQEKTADFGKTLKKLSNDFARILKYRILRKIIQDIYKALSQGIENIIAFDSATADSFNNIKNSLQYVIDALGAMLAPVIQMVEPLITTLADTFAELANSLGEVFASMNGQNAFASATKGAEDYASALKKTQSIGIDELNVLSQEKGGNFEYKDVNVQEDANTLKNAIQTIGADLAKLINELKPVIITIIEALTPILDIVGQVLNVLADGLGGTIQQVATQLKPMLSSVLSIIQKVVDLVDILFSQIKGGFNTALGNVLEVVGQIFEFVDNLLGNLMPILVQIVNIVSVVINVIFTKLSLVFRVVSAIFTILNPIINVISAILVPILSVVITAVSTIFYIVEAIFETIKDIFTFNWRNIGNNWKDMSKKIGDAWQNMARGNGEIYAKLGVETYTTGGFPKEDGLFMANHTEIIGQFSNGQTVVANNQQITEGIYQAVLSAMRESGGSGVVINLDGYEIAKAVSKRQDNFGKKALFGGNVNYGK